MAAVTACISERKRSQCLRGCQAEPSGSLASPELGVARRDLGLVHATVAQEAGEVADPLPVEREADVGLVDEVGGQLSGVVPLACLELLADLWYVEILVLPASHAHAAAEQPGERDLCGSHRSSSPDRSDQSILLSDVANDAAPQTERLQTSLAA
jgi:hypothetical protein